MKKIIVALCLTLLMITGCGEKTEHPAWTEAPDLSGTQTLSTEPSEPDSPAPQESLTASFLACGDNMVFYGNILDAASQPGTRAYNFAHTYQNVRGMIESADISMINQETLMSAEHGFSYYPDFNGPREMGLDLVDVGFDVICLANNHMMDMGEAGLRSTIDFWQGQPVTLIGGHKTKEDYNNIRIVEKNGVKVALLAYTYGTNDYDLTEESTTTLPILSESTVTEQVGRAKAAADFVVVSVHWGEEYTFTPNDYQRNYAEIMTEAG
ncbi:MAG: CapA family protein, partial [Clostridia bacterium]|nr:CapA family protein [Clostridia bacterium]